MATGPVEKKVRATWAASTMLGALAAVLNATLADSELLGTLPPWLQAIMILVGAPLVIGYPAWQASHTPRDDPDARKARSLPSGYGGL